MSEKSTHYIDNAEFLTLVKEYQELGESMSRRKKNRLGEIILLLVKHIAMKPSFCNYTYLDDMKSNAYYSIWRGINTFNPEKSSNPFSYFTQACINAFIMVINKEKIVFERNIMYGENILNKLKEEPHYKVPSRKKNTMEVKDNRMEY